MTTMTTHFATDQFGNVYRRTSKSRVYSHAVIVREPGTTGRGGAVYASRRDLAEKRAAQFRTQKWGKYEGHRCVGHYVPATEVVEVRTYQGNVKTAVMHFLNGPLKPVQA